MTEDEWIGFASDANAMTAFLTKIHRLKGRKERLLTLAFLERATPILSVRQQRAVELVRESEEGGRIDADEWDTLREPGKELSWYAAVRVARLVAEMNAGERAVRCDLVRDIFGNPFRPVQFEPEWRTDTVLSLARTMYESRDFFAMPILADALMEADCDSDVMLEHCRNGRAHARGCWLLDLLLGKE